MDSSVRTAGRGWIVGGVVAGVALLCCGVLAVGTLGVMVLGSDGGVARSTPMPPSEGRPSSGSASPAFATAAIPRDEPSGSPLPPSETSEGLDFETALQFMIIDPVFEESLTDQELRYDVLKGLIQSKGQDNCSVSLPEVRLAKPRDENGIWTEKWTLFICDSTTTYTIVFAPSPQGGTDFVVYTIE